MMESRRTTMNEVIDVDLWNRARWKGVAYLSGGGIVPGLVIVFNDRDAAGKIFMGWIEQFGKVDEDERIRISLIEGETPALGPGYTCHIGPSIGHVLGEWQPTSDVVYSITRLLRLPASPHLARFKAALERDPAYQLMVGVLRPDGGFDVHPDLVIRKRRLEIRRIDEIKTDGTDMDAIVLARPEGSTAHLN
jgi:hypothetical protein